ncbi:MAG: replicative DNA helicase [Trueperaceae bacterium]
MESRTPPQNLEAEQSVLGSVLLDNEVYAALEGVLRPEQFYKESHRKLFRAMGRLFQRGEPIDLVTLSEELRQTGQLDEVGNVPYLVGLADAVPTAAYAESYARIVAEKAVLRDLIGASGKILQTAYDQAMPLDEVLDASEKAIFELASSKRAHVFGSMQDLVGDTFAYINELFANPDPVSGLRTGFRELDQMTAGLQPASLNVLAARPSMGKTAFALTIAQNVALRENATVGLFSLEMSGVQLVTRMLCSEARVDMSRVRNGQLSDRDFQRLADTAGRMSEAKIFIDDNADLTVMELRSRSRRLKAEHGIDLIVVDYLQLMSGGGSAGRYGAENRQQEISSISRGLKALARELDIPVLVLSQLSRAVESRPNKRPMLSDLRECVTGDTLVNLSDGTRRPVAELVGEAPCVTSISNEGRLRPARAELVWQVGERDVIVVRTASGRTIRCTPDHRLLGANGWVTAGTLHEGDRLATARRLPAPASPERWEGDAVALLGQLIGDGSYLSGQPLRYTSASDPNLRTVATSARSMGSTVRTHAGRASQSQLSIGGNKTRWKAAGVGAWLKDLGVSGQRSFEKRVPSAAFRLANDQIGLLLQHLWATDGCIGVRKPGTRGGHNVYYATDSRGLAYDVAALLLRLGIVARIRSRPSRTERHTSYQVAVSGARDARIFLERVGAFGPRIEQAKRLAEALDGIRAATNTDTVPIERFEVVRERMRSAGASTRAMAKVRGTAYGGAAHFASAPSRATLASYAAVLDAPDIAAASNDLYWDRVTDVRPAGRELVYDLTVPDTACWLADGVVSHNSGAIEQDADLVMFIYRDEYYDPQSEKQGIAEILVGKQRNGPVGGIDLQFHNAHVRFNDLAKGSP